MRKNIVTKAQAQESKGEGMKADCQARRRPVVTRMSDNSFASAKWQLVNQNVYGLLSIERRRRT
jgi:hypothetical protein